MSGRDPGATWDPRAAFLPSAPELARHLANITEFPQDELPDLPTRWREVVRDWFAPDLAKVAQYYDVVGGRKPLNEKLHDIFNRDHPLSALHTFLADVPLPLLIVTTNYDDLIERSFKDRPYDVVIHATDPSIGDRVLWWPHREHEPRKVPPNKLDIDLKAVTVLYKMHGAVDRREPTRGQYVVTEDDYIDFLARMTKTKAIPSIFAEPFQTRPFLFLGYGLRDWNLRVVLNRVEKDLRRPKGITSWAIQRNPSPLERRFWQKRDVEVYDMDIDEFVKELASRWARHPCG